jgi:flagellar hook-basal body complex protein FliE
MYNDIKTSPLSDAVHPLNPSLDPKRTGGQKSDAPNFGDVLNGFLTDIDHMQNDADSSIKKLMAGENKNFNQAMGEARAIFDRIQEISNKMLEACNEVKKQTGALRERSADNPV